MNGSNARAILVTLIVLGLYNAAQRLSTPYAPTTEVAVLGVRPVLSAFILVELLSLFLPPLSGYRRQGIAGRRRLTRVALGAFVVIAVPQSYFLGDFLLLQGDSEITQVGDFFGTGVSAGTFRLVTILSWTATAAIFYVLAEVASRFGACNGLCLLVFGDALVWTIWDGLKQAYFLRTGESPPPDIQWEISPLMLLSGVAIACWLLGRRVTAPASTTEGEPLAFETPLVPQGAPTVTIAGFFADRFIVLTYAQINWLHYFPWPYSIVFLPFLAAVGAVLWRLFSSSESIHRGAAGRLKFDVDLNRRIARHARLTLAGFVAVWLMCAVLSSLEMRAPGSPGAFAVSMGFIFGAGALVLDMREQWRFTNRTGAAVRLLELDNAHLAAYVRALLEHHGVDHFIQTYHFRRLLFVMGAPYKMAVYVPPGQVERAMRLLKADEIQTV